MSKLLNIILLVYLGFSSLSCKVFETNHGGIILPKFIDQDKFTKNWNEDKGLFELYQRLKRDQDYRVYYYGFQVSNDGTIIGKPWDDDKQLVEVINYFKSTHWLPAYKKGYSTHKEPSNGMLEISVVPSKNCIKFRIDVGDGTLEKGLKTYDIYSKTKMLAKGGEYNN